jgi:tRNA threonylcarbamoyladenosine biosynthesis protein TsaE
MISESAEDTMKIGEQLAAVLKPGDRMYLYGELGSGKTVLVKGVCRGLGVNEEVTSPSFVIATEYQGRNSVAHIDLYRLGPKDIEEFPLEDYIRSDGVTIIEWADRLGTITDTGMYVWIKIKGHTTRELKIEDLRD